MIIRAVKKRIVLGIATALPVAALLMVLSWHGSSAAVSAGRSPARTREPLQPAKLPVRPCESTVESCPYVYTFDQQYFSSTQALCESAGQAWCPNQVGEGLDCNNEDCSSGSGGQCPTAVVSVFFECYQVGERGWTPTCRCFCWVVKK